MPSSGFARESNHGSAHFMLEQHQGNSTRRIHIVTATDEADRDRQMAKLVEADIIGAQDGFLCLMGKSLVH